MVPILRNECNMSKFPQCISDGELQMIRNLTQPFPLQISRSKCMSWPPASTRLGVTLKGRPYFPFHRVQHTLIRRSAGREHLPERSVTYSSKMQSRESSSSGLTRSVSNTRSNIHISAPIFELQILEERKYLNWSNTFQLHLHVQF